MRPRLLSRLLAISMLLLLAFAGLPAAAQDSSTDPTDTEESGVEDGSDDDESDEDSDDEDSDDDSDDDDERGARPSRGSSRLDTGEVKGHLAPAVSQVGQRVVVHATTRIERERGNGNGRPDHAGNPHDRDDETADDVEDDVTGDDVTGDPTEGSGFAQTEQDQTEEPGTDETEGAEDSEEALEQDQADDETVEDDEADEADDYKCEPVVPTTGEDAAGDEAAPVTDEAPADSTDEAAADSTDEEIDRAGFTQTDDETVEDEAEGDATEDDTTEDDEADEDEVDEDDAPKAPCDVTFTVDYGDGSAVEVMRPTKTRGGDGKRRAISDHAYEADGEYVVTVTAIPLEGPSTTFEMIAQVGSGSARLDGDSRIETAVRISQDSYPEDGSAQTVLIARADAFADALAASTLAFVQEGPVLLTASDVLPDVVLDEIARVLGDAGTVILLGGEQAIAADVETTLTDMGYTPVRLAGSDRIETALAIANHLIDGGLVPTEVVVASADNFPDALAGAAYAAASDAIILLNGAGDLDSRVADLVTTLGTDIPVLVVGGEAAVSPDAEASLAALGNVVERVSGETRFATAALLAERGYTGSDTVVLATGANYPDALAGAVYAARNDAPVLLVGDVLPAEVEAFLTAHAATLDVVVTLGGTNAVSDDVIDAAEALIQ